MPILNNKYLFIHIPKTGGTSIEESFGIRTRDLEPNWDILFGRLISNKSRYLVKYGNKFISGCQLQHLTILELIELGRPLDNLDKFSIVRDPYTKIVSEYRWWCQNNGESSFEKWLPNFLAMNHQHSIPQYKFVYNQGELEVTNIFHFEDFQSVSAFLNLGDIPIQNRSHNKIILNTFQKELILDYYWHDFNLFGYHFLDRLDFLCRRSMGQGIKHLIVSFIDRKYHSVFEIWKSYFEIYGYHILLISLDQETYWFLEDIGIRSILFPCHGNKKRLWLTRLDIIKSIVKLGYNVLHTDLDAYWIRNPIPLLVEPEHIYFSVAFKSPEDIAKKWGFILCCGFFAVPSTSVEFLELLMEKTREIGDDQIALNKLLYELQNKWKQSEIESMEYETDILNLKIMTIDRNLVTRSRYLKNFSIVFHPIRDKLIEPRKIIT